MILLDTHIVLWLAEAPELLSDQAVAAIQAAREQDGVAIADKTLWELAMLISRGRVGVRTSLREFLQEVERFCVILPLTAAIAERAVGLSKHYPKDPADRIIGATAMVHNMKLVTRDDAIRASQEVDCLW